MSKVDVVVTIRTSAGEVAAAADVDPSTDTVDSASELQHLVRVEQSVRRPTTADSRPPRPRKTPISLTIDPELLEALDTVAARLGLSRAAAISYGLSKFVESEQERHAPDR